MSYTTLGDPHLGRKFKTGVPLHRVGDRERGQWHQFELSLLGAKDDFHICMGDLFDKFVVPPEVVLRAARAYRQAAYENPGVAYIVIRGNHDVSRDALKQSSFDIFTALVADLPNVSVIDQVAEIGKMGFVPFCAFTPVADQIQLLSNGLEIVFMHHDYVDFGGDHVIPTEALAARDIFHVVNGHDHLPRIEKRHGVTVEMTGSMQPYTHAEDPNGSLYVTVTLDQLDGMDVYDKNVRVRLKEGESLPADLDCLSLTAIRADAEDIDLDIDTTDFDTLDMSGLLAKALDGLSIKDELLEAFHNDQ